MKESEITIRSTVELGRWVRELRRGAGLTQAEAAGLAGVGTRFLSDLENGKDTVRLGLVLRALERLGARVTVSTRVSRR